MLISQEDRRSDPVVVSRIIADTALYDMDEPSDEPKLGLRNMARLIEMYRYDAFRDNEPLGILGGATQQRRAPARSSLADVRNALMHAHRQVSARTPKERLCVNLSNALDELENPGAATVAARSEELLRQFIAAFAAALKSSS